MKYLAFLLIVSSYTLIGEGCHFPGLRGDKHGISFERPWGQVHDDAEKGPPADETAPSAPADED